MEDGPLKLEEVPLTRTPHSHVIASRRRSNPTVLPIATYVKHCEIATVATLPRNDAHYETSNIMAYKKASWDKGSTVEANDIDK